MTVERDHTADPAVAPGDEQERGLVVAARSGCRESLGLLFERYKGRLYTFLRRLVGDPHLAEDLLQETFVNVIAGLPNLRAESTFGGWLFRIAHNAARDRRRRAGRRQGIESIGAARLGATLPDVESTFASREMLARLERALEEMPDEQREVFLLRMHSPMSFAEIAEATGVTRSTAISRMHYAMGKLREALQQDTEARR